MKIFEKFYSYLTPKNIKYFSLASIFISFLFLSDSVFAEGEKTAWGTDPMVAFFSGLIKIVTVLLSIATVFVSALMSPEWTTWSVLWLDKPLKDLWYLISNIVYFLFSLIFIYIAIMNIIWKWGDYELKSALPRFIVWLLIVPFSWFIVQFVISISWVLTVAVLSIPYDTFKNTNIMSDDLSKTMVPNCTKNIIIWSNESNSTINTNNVNEFVKCEWEDIPLSEILNPKNSSNIFWIINIYTYWVMKIDKNAEIFNEDILKNIGDVANIVLKLWFDGVFVVVYCLLVLALMMALFVRWFWMWMFAMFSPLFWLLHFFKKWWSWAGWWDMKNFNFVQLIKLALMPVYVAGALSFWLLFLFVAWKWISWDSNENFALTNSWTTIKTWDVTLTLLWPVTNETSSFIKWFQWTIWTLILQFLWIAILWVAVIAALKSSEITQTVVSPFENMWNSIGKLIKNAPTYTPIIPTSEWMQSTQWLANAASSFSSTITSELNKSWSMLWSNTAKKFGFWDDELTALKQFALSSYKSSDQVNSWINKLLETINWERLKENWYREEVANAFKALWATDVLINEIRTNWKTTERLSWILDNFNDEHSINRWFNTESAGFLRDSTKNNFFNKDNIKLMSIIDWTSSTQEDNKSQQQSQSQTQTTSSWITVWNVSIKSIDDFKTNISEIEKITDSYKKTELLNHYNNLAKTNLASFDELLIKLKE